MSWNEFSAEPGIRVEVRSRFDHQWSRGFEVIEAVEQPDAGYRLLRRSDRSVLPAVFPREDVRQDRSDPDQVWPT